MSDEKKQTAQVEFFEAKDVGERPWGKEMIVAVLEDKYMGKVMYINKGSKGGLQQHHTRYETSYLFSGKMMFRYDNGDGKVSEKIIEPGHSIHIPPGATHQEEALEDCIVFECGTPQLNDRVRVEEVYGLPKGEGLPSTTPEEVKNVKNIDEV